MVINRHQKCCSPWGVASYPSRALTAAHVCPQLSPPGADVTRGGVDYLQQSGSSSGICGSSSKCSTSASWFSFEGALYNAIDLPR